MQYDFDTILDRRGRDALALDMIPYNGVEPKEGFSRIPMWVADMSFPTAPPVLEAIRARLDHPNFGYFQLSDAYFDSIIRWQQVRHGVTGLERQHIGYENGVLGGVSSVVQALTCPGEPILVHSPTYVGFTHTLERLGRPIIHTPLTQDAEGIWRMDYADMDRKLRENDIHVAILCSPHNPCGRVWERWELEKAMEVYAANDCTVISDEIWSDLIMPGYTHIPTQSVSRDAWERTVAFYAPTKTFSLCAAGRRRQERTRRYGSLQIQTERKQHAVRGHGEETGSVHAQLLHKGTEAVHVLPHVAHYAAGERRARARGSGQQHLADESARGADAPGRADTGKHCAAESRPEAAAAIRGGPAEPGRVQMDWEGHGAVGRDDRGGSEAAGSCPEERPAAVQGFAGRACRSFGRIDNMG